MASHGLSEEFLQRGRNITTETAQRDFSDDVLLMVKGLAHQGGLAIQNSSMFLQLEKDKKSLEEDIWSHRSWF